MPFEVASLLLLAAMIGAVMLGKSDPTSESPKLICHDAGYLLYLAFADAVQYWRTGRIISSQCHCHLHVHRTYAQCSEPIDGGLF